MNKIQTILYLGDQLVGDINKLCKNRHVEETLMSECSNGAATTPFMTFDISRKLLAEFVAIRFNDPIDTFIRVGRLRVVFIVDDVIVFSGYLSKKPKKSGMGAKQIYSLTFFNDFARLSGDLVSAKNDTTNPYRRFDNVYAHDMVKDLINDFIGHAKANGEVLDWHFDKVDTLGKKSIEYSDYQTISKALCDAMNNTTGAAKFDVVFRCDKDNHNKIYIDILKPRGQRKNIIIKYPGDGVYKLFSSTMEVEEDTEYASHVLAYGVGDLGNKDTGDLTAPIYVLGNKDLVNEYFYYKVAVSSNLKDSNNNKAYAEKTLHQMSFLKASPSISLVGLPIKWFDAENKDNGLALGDEFYFSDESDNGDDSGYFRIIQLNVDYDDNGVASVKPKLLRVEP